MRLRSRLVVAMAFLTLLTLGLSFWAVAWRFNRGQEKQLDDALLVVANEAAERAVNERGEFFLADGPGIEVNDAGPLPLYGAVYDEQGRPRAETPTFRGQPPHAGALHPDLEPYDFTCRSVRLRGLMVPLPGRPGAYLLLAVPRTDLDGDAAFLGHAMLIVFAIASVWSILVPIWLIRRLTREQRAVEDVVIRVAGGDLDARVHKRSGDLTVGHLGTSVDTMIERLSLLIESQQRFLAHAAHELRSPLTLVHGQLALALRRPREAEEYREAIGEALESTACLRALTEELLDFARAGAASAGPFEPVSIARAARGAVRYARADAERAGVAIELRVEDALVPGRVADLERLFRNLVENAVRHSPPGGRVSVEGIVGARSGSLEITVSDEGSGVPESDRGRLFEPFFRGTQPQGSGGAGLGLAIVREIARAHGGDVQLDPSAPSGARFVVRLPRWQEPARDTACARPAAASALQPS